MKLITSLINIFYPRQCINCHRHLSDNETVICANCRHSLPETDYTGLANNPVERVFYGRVPIQKATALVFYRKKGISRELIHHLKYKGRQDIGLFFGQWMFDELLTSGRFTSIDAIVKVPLHPKKKKLRGYNQLSTFAAELSKGFHIPVIENVLIKVGTSTSQTKKSRFKRFEKLNEKFQCVDTKRLENKHVLLIDDVLTTGATLEACANELLKTPGIIISIAVMAISDS